MARGRFLSTTIRDDKRLNSVSIPAEYLFLKCIPHLDRDGLISADTLWADVCPRRKELITQVDDLIDELAAVGLVVPYECDEGRVLWFPGFSKNQAMTHYTREAPSRFPHPSGFIPELCKPNPDELRMNSGLSPAEVEVEVEVEVEDQVQVEGEERARANSRKVVRHTSPYLDARHFVDGFIPTGAGATPVEVYYERFDIRENAARLKPMQEDDLARECPDLAKLRDVIVAYSRRNYRPGNVQLMLDWYVKGIPVNGNGAPSQDDATAAVKAAGARNEADAKRTAEKFGKPTRQRTVVSGH